MPELTEQDKLQLREELFRRFNSPDFQLSAIAKATREAGRQHKLAGNPIATWQDGAVVIVRPEDIEIYEEPKLDGEDIV